MPNEISRASKQCLNVLYPAINAGARWLFKSASSKVSFPYNRSWVQYLLTAKLEQPIISIHAMPPTTLSQNALAQLTELSAWFSETNEFKAEQENLLRCTNEGRHVRVNPLLGELGFNKIKVNRYTADRIPALTFPGIRLLDMANYGKNRFEAYSSLPLSILSFINQA